MNKKILIIVTKSDLGGVQTFAHTMAAGLKKYGHEVTVGFGGKGPFESKLSDQKINYIKFKHLSRTSNIIGNFLFIFELRNYLEKSKFDYVHFNSSNTLFGVLATKFLKNKPKTIFTVHGLSVIDPNYQINKLSKTIYKIFFKIFLNLVDKIVFVSNQNLKIAQENKITDRGIVIYNGIDRIQFFSSDKSRKILSEKTGADFKVSDFVIGSVGRLSYQKNYSFVIKLWKKVLEKFPKIKLLIIGDGDKKEELKNLIKSLKIENSVILAGAIDEADKYLTAFDIYVMPSLYEGQSLSLLAAQQTDISILASNLEENKEVLGNTYPTFKLNNEFDFLQKLSALIENHKASVNYSKNTSKFSSDTMVNNYLHKVYC